MKFTKYGCSVMAALAGLLAWQSGVAAQPWFELQIFLPPGTNGQETTHLTGGWPLLVRATAPTGAPTYEIDGPLAVVASDPSGCFNTLSSIDPSGTCLSLPPEEVFTNLWIDWDAPGYEDPSNGDLGLIEVLLDSAGGGGPVFRGTGPGGSVTSLVAGPETGAEVQDGFGFGANDDWPQLVMLSNHGVGVVLDEYFNRGPIEQRRNLAGFLTWVAYDLADEKGRSVVSSGTTVPYGLFSPLIMVDEAIGQPDAGGQYRSNFRFRVDGGPVQTGSYSCLSSQYGQVLYGMEYELRAFLVNGTAPSVLSDMDGDRDVDAVDAELSGLNVISTERTVRFLLWDGQTAAGTAFVTDEANQIYADLDGNGFATNAACRRGDVGPGRIRPPPK